MRVAVPLFGDEVSPRFGYSTELLVATVGEDGIRSEEVKDIAGLAPWQVIEDLSSSGVVKVICGGVQRHLQSEMEGRGMEVIWGVIGPAADALVALRDGTLRRDQFICRGRQRRHRGHGWGQRRGVGGMGLPGSRGQGGGEAGPGGQGPMSPRGRSRSAGRGGRTDEKGTGRRGT